MEKVSAYMYVRSDHAKKMGAGLGNSAAARDRVQASYRDVVWGMDLASTGDHIAHGKLVHQSFKPAGRSGGERVQMTARRIFVPPETGRSVRIAKAMELARAQLIIKAHSHT